MSHPTHVLATEAAKKFLDIALTNNLSWTEMAVMTENFLVIMLTYSAKLNHPDNKEMQKRFVQEILDSMTPAVLDRANKAIDE